MKKKYKKLTYSALTIIILLFLIGCAKTNLSTDLSEGSLNKIITTYWTLRLADKYEESYKYESEKGLPKFNDYNAQARLIKRIEIKSFSIKKIDIDSDKKRALVTIEFMTLFPPLAHKYFKTLLEDEWIYEDGRWQHVFR